MNNSKRIVFYDNYTGNIISYITLPNQLRLLATTYRQALDFDATKPLNAPLKTQDDSSPALVALVKVCKKRSELNQGLSCSSRRVFMDEEAESGGVSSRFTPLWNASKQAKPKWPSQAAAHAKFPGALLDFILMGQQKEDALETQVICWSFDSTSGISR